MFSFILGKYLKLESLGLIETISLILKEISKLLSKIVIRLYVPTSTIRRFWLLYSLPTRIWCLSLFQLNHSSGHIEVFCHFNLHFPHVLWCQVFSCIVGRSYILFIKYPLKPFAYLVVFLYYSKRESLYPPALSHAIHHALDGLLVSIWILLVVYI